MTQDPTVSFAATLDSFFNWAEAVDRECASLQSVARAPNTSRVYRRLKVNEIIKFAGITKRQWLDWSGEAGTDEGSSTEAEGHTRRPRSQGLTVEEFHQMQEELKVRPRRPDGKAALRILVSNFKGGAQKTTLALHLAHYLGLRGFRVLCIDTDSQGTLTHHMGLEPAQVNDDYTIGSLYRAPVEGDLLDSAATLLRPLRTHLDGVDIVPANLSLTALDFDIAKRFVNDPTNQGRRFFQPMEDALAELEHDYDVILIDSPPAFSFMAISLMWVTDSFIVPMPTQVPDFAGTGDFCQMAGEYMQVLEHWEGKQKTWCPALFVHARVAGGVGSDVVQHKSGTAFEHHRLGEYVADSKPIANCLGVFKSVWEATSKDTDAKGLARAQDAYFELCSRIEDLLQVGWEAKPDAGIPAAAELTPELEVAHV